MTIEEILRLVSDAGVVGLLAFAVIGGYRGWYVWRWHHEAALLVELDRRKEAEAREAEWKRLALRGADTIQNLTPLVASSQQEGARGVS